MKDLYFENQKELVLFLEDKEILGKGVEGTCYKVDDSTLKIYNESVLAYKQTPVDEYLQFKNLDIPHFNFIKIVPILKKKNI